MAASEQQGRVVDEEYVVQPPDRMAGVLRFSIFFLIVCLLSVVVFALWVGVLAPPAPRTRVESALLDAQAAVVKNPGSGLAWASLAGAQYAGGDTGAAWDSLAEARKRVKDHSILLINVKELDFLTLEGKNAQVIKKADEYLVTEAKFQTEEINKAAQKGIQVPVSLQNNADAIRLFVLKATAEGNLGKWKDAVKTLDGAMQLDDTAADLLTMRGRAKLKAGDKPGAAKDFAKALTFMPNDPVAIRGLKEATGTAPANK